jgi:hypothetical protein
MNSTQAAKTNITKDRNQSQNASSTSSLTASTASNNSAKTEEFQP